ncbi:MAG: phosphodiester glycosidase family protein [Bacteroidota bacterium]
MTTVIASHLPLSGMFISSWRGWLVLLLIGSGIGHEEYLTQLHDSWRGGIMEEKTAQISSAERITYRGATYDTYTVSLKEQEVRLFWQGKDGLPYKNLRTLKVSLESEGKSLLFGMNAGMYKKDRSPQGLYIEDGQTRVSLDTGDANGNFYLKPNGVFLIREDRAEVVETSQFSASPDILYATQSGPLLLHNGKIHQAFREGSKNLHIRNGVGIISPDKMVFVISNEVVNLYDFASLFKEHFGCEDALYLDGAISKMYAPDLNRSDLGGNLGPLIGVIR